jgi:hypothetical protein
VNAILVDTGPLVALLDRSDPFHQNCREAFQGLTDDLVTVWPVLTEAMYMLNSSWDAQSALWDLVITGPVKILPLLDDEMVRIKELMEKYRDLPMDLADAVLVRMAEREKIRRVFTLDRRGFGVYRPSRLGRFLLIPE